MTIESFLIVAAKEERDKQLQNGCTQTKAYWDFHIKWCTYVRTYVRACHFVSVHVECAKGEKLK